MDNVSTSKINEELAKGYTVTESNVTPSYSSHLKKKKHHLKAVETMFKTASANHLKLSVMADNKALIMITVNSIIISVGIGLLISKFVQNQKIVIPTILLLIVNVAAIIYAVLATRPRKQTGTFTRKDLEDRKVNLLFYGSFYKMDYEEFDNGLQQLMDDNEFLYGTLKKDIYWQGRVIGYKFRLLRISYDLFMFGMAISVVAYVIAALV